MSEEFVVPAATPARSARAVRPIEETRATPSVEAGGVRRWLHVAIAAAGWALFLYWWWIVAHRTLRSEVEASAVFLGVALLLVVGTTGFWVLHNRALFRRKGPRMQTTPDAADPTQDALGLPLLYEGGPETLRGAEHVRILVENSGKRYRAARS